MILPNLYLAKSFIPTNRQILYPPMFVFIRYFSLTLQVLSQSIDVGLNFFYYYKPANSIGWDNPSLFSINLVI